MSPTIYVLFLWEGEREDDRSLIDKSVLLAKVVAQDDQEVAVSNLELRFVLKHARCVVCFALFLYVWAWQDAKIYCACHMCTRTLARLCPICAPLFC